MTARLPEKSLFVPLKRQWFDEFASGTKREEVRRYGPRWNENTCRIGRPIVLSLGYSGRRLGGWVTTFRRVTRDCPLYGPAVDLAIIGVLLYEDSNSAPFRNF